MKVIHVMTRNSEGSMDLNDNILTEVVAFLSVLKWKSFGFTTKIYVDEYFKEKYSKSGLLDLYDEVDDTFFTEADLYAEYNINKYYFWAFSKLFVYLNEPEPFIMSDMDFIPLQDFHSFLDHSFVYYNESLTEDKTYPNKDNLPCAKDYIYPEWLTWHINPSNTAVCYINNQELKDLYIQEAIRYAKNNSDEYEGMMADENEFRDSIFIPRMVFAEQRLLPEAANYLGVELKEIKSKYEMIINPREIHLFLYKTAGERWLKFFLEKLYQEFPEVYNKLINFEEYSEIKEKIDTEGFTYIIPKMLKRANW